MKIVAIGCPLLGAIARGAANFQGLLYKNFLVWGSLCCLCRKYFFKSQGV